jgi:hypothetical protein
MGYAKNRKVIYYHIDESEYAETTTARWDEYVNHLIIQMGTEEKWYDLMDDLYSTGSLPSGEDWFRWKDGIVVIMPLIEGEIQ